MTTTEAFPPFTKNAIIVMNRRYLMKDAETKVPTEEPDSMFIRVADDLAQGDRNYGGDDQQVEETSRAFYGTMRRQEFLPNSPTLMNAGRELQQLSACFVLPVDDDLDSIFSRVKDTALIHQSGGGTGFAFSRLRPEGDIVRSSGGVASGPASFIRAFDVATDVVKQGGTRRGANMGVLSVYHQDIIKFIESKRDGTELQNFNISVAVDKHFMDCVQRDAAYDVINPRTQLPTNQLQAREVFDLIVQCAWETGDPGLVFLDRINADNPNPQLGEIESTNPCVAGDTVVATTEGPMTALDLVGRPFVALVNGQEWPSGPEGFFSTGHRPVIRITTEASHSVTLTPDHLVRIRTTEGDQWTQAQHVSPGDNIVLHRTANVTDHGRERARHIRRANATATPVHEPQITDTDACPVATVTGAEPAGWADVYDTHVHGINAFDGNGIYLHQCGEQPLLPWESCNLGSINLRRMLTDDPPYKLDWDKLEQVAQTAVHMLDNVIDRNNFPVDEIAHMTRQTRRIGVGVMGWADVLTKLRIRYDSQEALALAEEVMSRIQQAVQNATEKLAVQRGPFPAWEGSKYAAEGRAPMRNSAPTTIAPTGTISIIAGASSGIEPLFALAYKRTVMDGEELLEVNDDLMEAAEQDGFTSPELMQSLRETGMIAPHIEVPQWVRDTFRTSQEIDPVWHVRMQAAFQKHTENAVSKTINLPHEATVEDVETAYRDAWDMGCKGITVYRDGSKREQVLTTGRTSQTTTEEGKLVAASRPAVLEGKTYRVRTGHGNAYIIINRDENGEIFEVFSATGKAGSCDAATMQAITRLISMALRSGIDPQEVTDQLRGNICCPSWDNGLLVGSPTDAIGIAIEKAMGIEHRRASHEEITAIADSNFLPRGRRRCPDCSDLAYLVENCAICRSCGWSECA